MKIEIESTDHVVDVNGHLSRVWNGVTEDKKKCLVFVRAVMMHENAAGLVERELIEIPPLPVHEVVPR